VSRERLQKVLAAAGLASRRGAERLIAAGRVAVDGETVADLGRQVDPELSVVTLDGRPLAAAQRPAYYMLHKPAGHVTTLSDPQGRPTVRDLLGGIRERVFPVGRLDRDVSGLLILTNDGELAKRLMHPSWLVPKVYHAKVEGGSDPGFLRALTSGAIIIDGRPAAPAKARELRSGPDRGWVELILTEGRNRQVKRMCAAAGRPVEVLKRVAYCGLRLPPDLPPGRYAPLSAEAVRVLKTKVGLIGPDHPGEGG
jgi:23S rRNA pseudouridine2605 synthase